MKLVRIQAALTWIVFQDIQSHYWVGVCEALKISSQGETFSDLRQNIEDALAALMADLVKRQELDLFLQTHKWTIEGEMPERPSKARFDIPYNIERRNQHDLQGLFG